MNDDSRRLSGNDRWTEQPEDSERGGMTFTRMQEDRQLNSEHGTMTPGDSRRHGSLRKLTGLATLVAALTLMVALAARVGSGTDAFPVAIPATQRMPGAAGLPPQCALKYAAVLDLAELARGYGKSSGVYRHAFGDVSGQMDACRTGKHYASSSGVVRAEPRA